MKNWLTIAFRQPTTRVSEIFYFDKRDNQFFSILVTDYVLFDDNLNLGKNVASTYSKASLAILEDRIKRIGREDSDIVVIPRLGDITEREAQDQVELFLKANNIDLENVTVWAPGHRGTLSIKLED